jgi:methylenetetrahydrofolate dehydrogenase (NADP+) / methenyltetrahydrofolate cyclohydrolase
VTAQIIDGKAIAARLRADLGAQVAALAARGIAPGLHVVMVGENPASQVYVRNKAKACAEAGVACEVHRLPTDTPQDDLLALVERLNGDPAVSGVIVQLPLPEHMDEAACMAAVAPHKDVDGFHPVNLGRLLGGAPGFVPCTPAGVLKLLEAAKVPLAGRRAVVVGRGNVGLPLAVLLTRADATVTVCHSKTRDLGEVTRAADILVAAVGRPAVIGADMVRPGAAVIDVGINRLADGPLVGDVDFQAVREVAGWITPVPGGVGPMTVAMLLANTVRAAESAG